MLPPPATRAEMTSRPGTAPVQRRTLADIILEKIREKEEREAREAAGIVEEEGPRLPAKVWSTRPANRPIHAACVDPES